MVKSLYNLGQIWLSNLWKTSQKRPKMIASGFMPTFEDLQNEKYKWYIDETCLVYVTLWCLSFDIKFGAQLAGRQRTSPKSLWKLATARLFCNYFCNWYFLLCFRNGNICLTRTCITGKNLQSLELNYFHLNICFIWTCVRRGAICNIS